MGVRCMALLARPARAQGVSHISCGNESKDVALRYGLHCRVVPICCFTYAFRNSGQPLNVSCSVDQPRTTVSHWYEESKMAIRNFQPAMGGKCVLPVGTYWSYGMNSFQNMRVAVQTDPLP